MCVCVCVALFYWVTTEEHSLCLDNCSFPSRKQEQSNNTCPHEVPKSDSESTERMRERAVMSVKGRESVGKRKREAIDREKGSESV